jgi:predicted small integral membrane protein
MIVVRAAKISLVAAIALFASLVAFGNLTDYNTNFVFVEHVLSMDTIYPFSVIKYRAVSNPALQHTAYALIIITQVIIAVLFNQRKTFAILGLTLGFLLWQVGFMSVGGEWFGMWQSQQWNGVPSAFRFVMAISVVLILVSMPDYDIERQSRS